MLWETPSPWLVQHFVVLKKHVFKFWTPLFKTLWEAEVAALSASGPMVLKSQKLMSHYPGSCLAATVSLALV